MDRDRRLCRCGAVELHFYTTGIPGLENPFGRRPVDLDGDPAASAFSGKVRDISQVLALHSDELKSRFRPLDLKVTYHDPCHIAHCQGIRKEPRDLLKLVPGLAYKEMAEADACCGSAGTYNIAKPEMSDRILKRKLDNIAASGCDVLVTSNPGCLLQLKKGLAEHLPGVRIMHLTEVLLRSINAA